MSSRFNEFDEIGTAGEALREEYFVESQDSTSIAYDLYGGAASTLALVVPGFWRTKRHPAMVELARFLLRCGYRAAVMDPRGHGRSKGIFAFNTTEHTDVASVVRDAARRSGSSAVVLVGLSAGGAISVTAVSRHELPVVALVLISPVGDFTRVTPGGNPLRMRGHLDLALALTPPRFRWFRGRHERISARDEISRIRIPVCLVHVKHDWLVPHENSEILFAAANEPKELHLLDIEGNYHADRIFTVAGNEARQIITSFLRRFAPIHEEPRIARLPGQNACS